ncbi:MAG: class II glutamine amidotransferase [Halieaceae bacterium]|nr:class II glutamine amidotransferase [Halieaceae bacterium]
MCRWLAYSGGAIPLAELIFNTRHSLIDQSLDARLGPNTTNGDGFGVGWFDRLDQPGMYKSTQPAWNDDNLHDLCEHTESPLFLAHIRASTGTAVEYNNCHPFRYNNWLFVHNGVIRNFARIRRQLVHELDDDHFRGLHGATDSELMFMLAMQFGLTDNPQEALARMVGFVERIGWDTDVQYPVQMTLGIADGKNLYGVRYSSEGESRTLYHSRDLAALEQQLNPRQEALLEKMSTKARAVVSEPLSELQQFWEPIPESSFVTVVDGEVTVEPFKPIEP